MAKKKKRNVRPKINYACKDWHHLLFQKRHWQTGYAKLLREHEYMGAMIPKATLHREIHSKIHDIPVPNGKECKEAYVLMLSKLEDGTLNMDDKLEARLDFLINIWQEKCPATCAVLQWQSEVISKFYSKGR